MSTKTRLSCYLTPSISSFEAQVQDCHPSPDGLSFTVTLDQSYFFPTGGGQPSDRGAIGSADLIEVTLVDGILQHITRSPLNPGSVTCRIDMAWRRHFMEQHTGQHIISGALWQIGEYKTVSVHLGEKETTIEVDSSDIGPEELQNIENRANEIIRQNLPIETMESHAEELHRYPLRKMPDLSGEVRLVRVGEFDTSVCCGLHLSSSAQTGLVKYLGMEKIRGHVRTIWAIGLAALADYHRKHQLITRLGQTFSTSIDTLETRSSQLLEENRQLLREVSELEGRLADHLTHGILLTAAAMPHGSRLITGFLPEKESLVMKVVKNLLNQDQLIFCLLSPSQEKTAWAIGCSEGIRLDFNLIREGLLIPFGAKGGGRPPLWKGQLPDSSQTEAFLSTFKSVV